MFGNDGKLIEDYIRTTFKLRQMNSRRRSIKPDIFDDKKRIVGEIKSVKEVLSDQNVVVYTDQINRYKELTRELNNGSINKYNISGLKTPLFSLYYFFVFYNEKPLCLELETFILGEKEISELLQTKEIKKTCWALSEKFNKRVRNIRDENQTQLYPIENQEETLKRILEKNKRGSYIRIRKSELVALCPENLQYADRLLITG